MQIDKFTIKAQELLAEAQRLASENGNPSIDDIHLMSAMLEQREGIILPILKKLEVDVDNLLNKVKEALAGKPKVTGGAAQLYISP